MVIILNILYISKLFINFFLVSKLWVNKLYILIKDCIIMQITNNIVIKYILFIKNNLFQLNIAYIFLFNSNPIFYNTSAILLNSWKDFINTSFSINPE